MMAIEQEWWKNRLAEDIYATLKLKEQTLPQFHAQSTQLWIRRHLVDWLSVIVGELGICATAQHLAVYLLDYFMDALEVELCYIHLVALTCLMIAVKFEDHCDRIPHFSKLNSYLPQTQFDSQPYTAKQYLNMELNLLKFSAFELCIPTVPDFLPYFLKVAVDDDDLRDGLPITCKTTVETYLEKYAAYFQEIVLQDTMFRSYAPSLVAASCVAAARICLHLTPTWPKQLELMTDYYLEQLLPCLQSMLGTHEQDSSALSRMSEPPVVSCSPSAGTYSSYPPSSSYYSGYFSSSNSNYYSSSYASTESVNYSTSSDSFPVYMPMQQSANYFPLSCDTQSYLPEQKSAESCWSMNAASVSRQPVNYKEQKNSVVVYTSVNHYNQVPQIVPRVRSS